MYDDVPSKAGCERTVRPMWVSEALKREYKGKSNAEIKAATQEIAAN